MISHISVLALGGTIASRAAENRLAQPELTAEDLVALVGGGREIGPLQVETLVQAPSGDLRFETIATVAERIREVIAAGAAGVVVTQGTDTLEETAFQLDLLLDVGPPVVVTGALRNPGLPGADGAANLLAAIRVAAAPQASGMGVLVVMNDEIHAARFVRKTHTYKPSAFASPGAGTLGWIAEDRVQIVLRPNEPTPTVAWRGEPPDVPLITLGFSMSATMLGSLSKNPLGGLVIAGLGVGHAPSWMVEPIGVLASKIPVVLASRIGAGAVFSSTYGYPGSESDLLNRGCIGAGYLDPLKARVLLALLLAEGADRERIADIFSRY